MVERAARKSKNDVDLQAQSTRGKKGQGKWFDKKGRRGYNNSIGRGNQQEGNYSNQIRPPYQSNHRGGVTSRGRGGERNPDKRHIQ